MYTAHRVRSKTRAAVKRREEQVEQEEMESGELNLIPYLDMVTNLMLFLLASVSAGLILVQIDTTLPDKAPPDPTKVAEPQTNPDDQPLKMFVSLNKDQMILWSASSLEGTLQAPKAIFKKTGVDGDTCDGAYMCQSNTCEEKTQRCVQNPTRNEAPAPVYDWRALNKALIEIVTRRYAGKQRKDDTYEIVLQADGSIPYSTIVATMAAMRCTLPDAFKESTACSVPTDDEALKKATSPISPDGKLYDTTRASYDPKKMALFHEIAFSSGFE